MICEVLRLQHSALVLYIQWKVCHTLQVLCVECTSLLLVQLVLVLRVQQVLLMCLLQVV